MTSQPVLTKRLIKRTILAFGEGPTERAFLKHIHTTLNTRNLNISITVDSAHGGSPLVIVKSAIKLQIGYDSSFVLMDNDTPWGDMVLAMASEHEIELIPSAPCVEALVLNILDPKRDYSSMTSRQCKKIFHKECLDAKQKLDHRNYRKLLPETILRSAQSRIKSLDKIVKIMML